MHYVPLFFDWDLHVFGSKKKGTPKFCRIILLVHSSSTGTRYSGTAVQSYSGQWPPVEKLPQNRTSQKASVYVYGYYRRRRRERYGRVIRAAGQGRQNATWMAIVHSVLGWSYSVLTTDELKRLGY